MPRLTEDEYKATWAPNPARVELDAAPPFDFWPYFEAIPPDDLAPHDFSDGAVTHAWRMPGTTYEHVLVRCRTPDVFLVLVLDVAGHTVVGHRVLDLNQAYGLA
jgi:hypothetical protein